MESKVLQEVVDNILTYIEDNEHIELTPEIIETYLEEYLDKLAEEVYNELNNY